MSILTRIQEEPVLTHGLFMALVNLVLAFGVPITEVQLGSINVALIAALSFLVRSQVTPMGGFTPVGGEE